MSNYTIPELSEQDIHNGLKLADLSMKRRHPKLLHNPGDEFNRVFNFMMRDSYMQPHLHPGIEKIERIHVMHGRIAVLFFDSQADVRTCTFLERGQTEFVEVPAFTWHTYVMLSDHAISYETMMGIYKPETWKRLAEWAPQEDSLESSQYLDVLKQKASQARLGLTDLKGVRRAAGWS